MNYRNHVLFEGYEIDCQNFF